MEGSYYDIPKALFYLLKGTINSFFLMESSPHEPAEEDHGRN